MIETIETEAGFDALEPEWRRIDETNSVHVHQTFDWLRAGWDEQKTRAPGDRLWIVKWTDGADVVIFPFCITQGGVLRFIFETHTDNLGAVYSVRKNRCICYHELAAAIRENKAIRRVCLHKIPLDNELVHYLPVLLKGSSVLKDNAYSWLDVPKSANAIASFAHMKSKDRADLKGVLRKAADKAVRVISASRGDAFPKGTLEGLVASMRAGGLRTRTFFPDALTDFAAEMFRRGRLDVAVMSDSAGTPVALNFLLKKDGKYLSWIFLYSDPHASTELYVKLISDLAQTEAFVFDFGVGVYSYKIGTFRPNVSPTLGVFWGRNYWQYSLAMKEALVRCLKDYVKSRIGR